MVKKFIRTNRPLPRILGDLGLIDWLEPACNLKYVRRSVSANGSRKIVWHELVQAVLIIDPWTIYIILDFKHNRLTLWKVPLDHLCGRSAHVNNDHLLMEGTTARRRTRDWRKTGCGLALGSPQPCSCTPPLAASGRIGSPAGQQVGECGAHQPHPLKN